MICRTHISSVWIESQEHAMPLSITKENRNGITKLDIRHLRSRVASGIDESEKQLEGFFSFRFC